MNSPLLVFVGLVACSAVEVVGGMPLPPERDAEPSHRSAAVPSSLATGESGHSGRAARAASDTPKRTDRGGPANAYALEAVEGRVVWLAEAVAARWGVHLVPEAAKRLLALESPQGRLAPILEDSRGRAFRLDPRLRAMTVRLLVRRYRDLPLIQIVDVEEIRDGQRYKVDYWCDVCAIQMFEMGPCSCCQAPNRLRKRRVTQSGRLEETEP